MATAKHPELDWPILETITFKVVFSMGTFFPLSFFFTNYLWSTMLLWIYAEKYLCVQFRGADTQIGPFWVDTLPRSSIQFADLALGGIENHFDINDFVGRLQKILVPKSTQLSPYICHLINILKVFHVRLRRRCNFEKSSFGASAWRRIFEFKYSELG